MLCRISAYSRTSVIIFKNENAEFRYEHYLYEDRLENMSLVIHLSTSLKMSVGGLQSRYMQEKVSLD